MASTFTNNSSLFIFLLFSRMILLSSRPVAAQSPSTLDSNSQYNYFSPSNFTSSMLIVVLLLIVGFFLFGFFSVFIRQCVRGEHILGAGAGPTMQTPVMNRQSRGLDPATIEKFPIMVYSDVKEHKIGKRALECAICLSEFEDDEKLRLLPQCSHVFHPDCIDAWLASHVTCPVCRCNLTNYEIGVVPNPEETMADGDAVVIEVQTEPEEEEEEEEEEEGREERELERIRSMRRAAKRKYKPRLPRPHSTGHSLSSLSRSGEDRERYTLRVPEQVLRQMMAEGVLRRSRSAVGLKEGGDGSSRGGRSTRMLIFIRGLSERFSPAWGMGIGIGRRGDGEGEGSTVRGRSESLTVRHRV